MVARDNEKTARVSGFFMGCPPVGNFMCQVGKATVTIGLPCGGHQVNLNAELPEVKQVDSVNSSIS
ncbi:MAG: hypothetical protein NTV60_01885 [Candidatus Kaiserbacteria bacterium]|nr:hypothetical protein [Candidatus Kaiserbacteria bacterium]